MSLATNLLAALKQVLKREGITYKAAAQALDLSEVSVKRIFSDRNITLARLEKLCEIAGTDLGQLIQITETNLPKLDRLTIEQEMLIIKDKRLLLVGVCLINRWSYEEILGKYQFTPAQLTGLLVKLDRMKIIELLPGNRYHLLISRHFRWQRNGPIQKYFAETILGEYLSEKNSGPDSLFRFVWGMLSRESAQELNKKIQRLLEEFVQTSEYDTRSSADDKLSSSLLLLFREDWEPSLFKALWRKEGE